MRSRSIVAPLLALTLLGCDAKEPANRYVEPPPPPVTVAKPARENVQLSHEWTGRIVADSVDIRSRTSGFLHKIHFRDGQDVKTGDPLFDIDPRPFEAACDRARAEIAAANAKVALTQAEVARYQELFSVDAASQAELDLKEAHFEVSKADLDRANAALRTAEIDLSYTKIAAPIDGRIGESRLTVGALVSAIDPAPLTTIVQLQPIYCYFAASELEFLEYQKSKREGLTKAAPDGKTLMSIGLRDEEGTPHDGVLDYGDSRLDETTGTLLLRGSFANTDLMLAPGLFARVRIPGPDREALLVPEAVVQIDQSGRFVLVVGADNIVERRDVTLGVAVGNRSVVATGLTGDERVVVNGIARARPGSKVAPTEAAAK
jgi:RND family efflux transporter MFP subunit